MEKYFTNKIFLVATGLIVLASANAQKKMTEGSILYDISIANSSEKPKNAQFLDGATSAVYIKGGKSRTEMVSSLGTQTTIVNQENGKKNVTFLKEYGDQKYMITLTPTDWAEVNKKYDKVSFTLDPTATKTIQGYLVKKAIGTMENGTTFTVWYTPDIVVENNDFQYMNRSLPGLALEYESVLGDLRVTYTVSKLTFTPVAVSKFELPKAGFRVMTYQESKGKSN